MMNGNRRTILVSGMIAGDPYQGGATWAVLQYVLGFRRLGHEVYLIEPVDDRSDWQTNASARYFKEVTREFGLEESAALLHVKTRRTVGLPYDRLIEAARRSDVLFNISGMLNDPELTDPVDRRVYLDLDPAFNQLWQAAEGIDRHLEGHHVFVTVGQSIGKPECPVPTCGRQWIATLPPVVLEHWPETTAPPSGAITTVGNWRSYGPIQYQGVLYGQRAHSLRQIIGLPRRTRARLVLALAIHEGDSRDIEALRENGWELTDPIEAVGTPGRYRDFIQLSAMELGVAKSGYVVSRSGWFSDRSACYLASGRPVIAQDTGFSAYLPTGVGLLSFASADDAAAAIERIMADPQKQGKKARQIAQEHFDSDRVLPALLAKVGA
jgi:hypothetical protein